MWRKARLPVALKSFDPNSGAYTGYAATFGNKDLGGDIILPGAFTASLAAKKSPSEIRVLWQHSQWNPIGVTAKAEQDDTGLYVEGNLIMDVQQASECAALAKAGALGGLSIGYMINDYEMLQDACILKTLDVLEYSFVTFPMNPEAEITSMKDCPVDLAGVKNLRDCEAFLRDACGLSRNEAKTLIARIRQTEVKSDLSEMLEKADPVALAALNKSLSELVEKTRS